MLEEAAAVVVTSQRLAAGLESWWRTAAASVLGGRQGRTYHSEQRRGGTEAKPRVGSSIGIMGRH